MVYSLLDNASSKNLFLEPFPHLIIENALPSNYYEEINKNFPLQYFESLENSQDNNIRKDIMYPEFINKSIKINKIWRDFVDLHSSDKFYHQILNLFIDQIMDRYQNLFKNKSDLYNIENKNYLSTSVNTPVINRSSVRDAHLDKKNKLFTGLFYLKSNNDYSDGGDLNLYSWKASISTNQKRHISFRSEIPNKYVQFNKSIKYKANTFVIFLNSLDSLHGVSPRSVTSHYRKMCVYTSVLPFSIDTISLFDKAFLKYLKLQSKFIF